MYQYGGQQFLGMSYSFCYCQKLSTVTVYQIIVLIFTLFVILDSTSVYRTDFPKPEMLVSCLSDGVQVEILINEREGFNGVLYVKGHSKDEQCRRVLTLPANSQTRTELFKVQFGNCGLIHVNVRLQFLSNLLIK